MGVLETRRLKRVVYFIIIINSLFFLTIIFTIDPNIDPGTPGTVQNRRFRIKPDELSGISFGVNESFLKSYRFDLLISAPEGSIIELVVLDGESWKEINTYYENVTSTGQIWTDDLLQNFIFSDRSNLLNYYTFYVSSNSYRFTEYTNTIRSIINRQFGKAIDFYFLNDNSDEIEIEIVFNFAQSTSLNLSGVILFISMLLLGVSIFLGFIIIFKDTKMDKESNKKNGLEYFKQQVTVLPTTLFLPVYQRLLKTSNRDDDPKPKKAMNTSELNGFDDKPNSDDQASNKVQNVEFLDYIEMWGQNYQIKPKFLLPLLIAPILVSGIFLFYLVTELGPTSFDYIRVLFSGTKDEKLLYTSNTVIPLELDLISQLILVFLIYSLSFLIIQLSYFGIKNLLRHLGYADRPKRSLVKLKDIITSFYELDYENPSSNEHLGKNLAQEYLSYDENIQAFELKAIDPDWELETILDGFLTTFGYSSFFGFINTVAGLFLLLLFSFFNIYFFAITTNSNIYDLTFFSQYLVYGYMPVIAFICFPAIFLSYYLITHVKDSLIYLRIRKFLLNELSDQILNLSTEETYYFEMKKESLREIDRKLDLNSAVLTYQSLKATPIVPFFPKIYTFVKYLSLISILTYLYSIFVV